jgi:putative ATP-binding cassette transporter
MAKRLFVDARTFLGRVWRLSAPYWKSEERLRAWALLVATVGLTLALVYMAVLFNDWNRVFYNSLEQKNAEDFKDLLLYFCFLASVYIGIAVYRLYLRQMLTMRWRVWLTRQYLGEWLDDQVYYRMELDPHGTDNPDQRIAEDLRLFTEGTIVLGLGLLNAVVTLASFVFILWTVSGPISFMLFGSEVTIQGYMVWVAIVYALAASFLSHYIGRPLIGLNFQQQRLEADFRFNLVRLRENAEGIALYHGEKPEHESLERRFERVRSNWWDLMHYTKRLTYFTAGYTQVALVFPFIVAAPRFFSGAIPLGGLMQIANAFGEVQTALSWFVNAYTEIAAWKASVDRLLTFQKALDATTEEAQKREGIEVGASATTTLEAQGIDLALPARGGVAGRVLLSGASLSVKPGERVLVTGPSGSGKSTLFRALAGIWPYGKGEVRLPRDARILFLPQKAYIPIATLRDAVTYPAPPGSFGDEAIREALTAAKLESFAGRLDEEHNWSMQMSPGEQQRLAVARALLYKPDWLFLDEATASLNEPLENEIYSLLRERLPDTAMISIAHRPSVARFHERRYELVPGEGSGKLVAAS